LTTGPLGHSSAYRLLDHTSDIKVEIYGRDLPELFANAAFCLFDVMLDRSKVRPDRTETVSLKSPDLNELFLDWLRELLFLFSTHGFAVARTEVHVSTPPPNPQSPLSAAGVLAPATLCLCGSTSVPRPNPHSLTARLWGEPYDLKRHGLKIEIKTPTYYEYSLESTASGYKATLVLDV
jgi:SHS2 domain-containing protein